MSAQQLIQPRERALQLQQYLQHDPHNAHLLGELATLHLQLGEFNRALELINQALDSAPQDTTLQFDKATIAMAAGFPEEAVAIYELLQSQGVDSAILRFNYAYACLYLRQYARARKLLESVPGDDPQLPEYQLLYARVLHRLGDLEPALALLHTYVGQHPENAQAAGELALLAVDNSHNADGEKWARQALILNPNQLEALIALGTMAFEQDQETEARLYYDKAVSAAPRSGRALSGLGLVEMMSDNVKGAKDCFTKAVKTMPDHIGTWHALGWCQLLGDDMEGARVSFNRSMELNHNFSETHGALAVIDIFEGRLPPAESKIKKSLRLDPANFSGLFAQSLLAQSQGDMQTARKITREILLMVQPHSGKKLKALLAQLLQGEKGI